LNCLRFHTRCKSRGFILLFMAKQKSIVIAYHIFFNYSSTDRHEVCFCLLAIVDFALFMLPGADRILRSWTCYNHKCEHCGQEKVQA
ncbi:mCG145157, partial [Mus musculus]